MAKLGEIEFLQNIGETGRRFAWNKPFATADCADYLMEIGAILALLPPPPGRLLDVGCGTGWTSRMFARRGYRVLGVDIAADMIDMARQISEREHIGNVTYRIGDYEDLKLDGTFQVAVFFDALHHAVDEEAALRMVYGALRPGGICVTSEPGCGHASSKTSQAAMAQYQVTEKDMPPRKIIAVARRVGFREFRVYPHAFDLAKAAYRPKGKLDRLLPTWLGPLRTLGLLAALPAISLTSRVRSGIVVMTK